MRPYAVAPRSSALRGRRTGFAGRSHCSPAGRAIRAHRRLDREIDGSGTILQPQVPALADRDDGSCGFSYEASRIALMRGIVKTPCVPLLSVHDAMSSASVFDTSSARAAARFLVEPREHRIAGRRGSSASILADAGDVEGRGRLAMRFAQPVRFERWSASCPGDIDFSCGFHSKAASGTRVRARRRVVPIS